MPFNYQLSEEAEQDVEEGYLWYENKRVGLGEEFLESLDQAKAAVIKNPTTYQIWYKKKLRRFVVDCFPYLVLYVVNVKNIDVISIFNTHQHPRKWKGRM